MAFSRVSYVGDGSTKQFQVTFDYLSKKHVKVYVDYVETTDFTWISDSTIALTTAPAPDAKVIIMRETPKERLVDFVNSSTLNEETLDRDANQMAYIVQEAFDHLMDTISSDVLDNTWDAEGRRIKNIGYPEGDMDAVNKTFADEVMAYTENLKNQAQASADAAATSEANAAQSEANAKASENAAATSEVNAATSETNAANSASAAATSETNAAQSETNAANSANDASISETNAANSASAASASATNAANSADAAAISAVNAANSAAEAVISKNQAAQSAANAIEYGKRIIVSSTEPENPQDGDIWVKVV